MKRYVKRMPGRSEERILQIGILIILSIAFACQRIEATESPSNKELLSKIVRQATQNEQKMESYGFDIKMNIRWLKRDGEMKKSEIRSYRTAWVEDKRHLELHRINNRPLTLKQRKAEEKNKKEWQKAIHNEKKNTVSPKLPFTWDELMQKYDFVKDSKDKSAAYVLEFKHKKTKLPERSRIEKVLNHLSGKLWVDENFQIIKIQGHLSDGISFGFGLVKVNALNIEYEQIYYKDLVVPAILRLDLKVKSLFFYSEARQITGMFENYRLRPELEASLAETVVDHSLPEKR